MSGWYEDPDAWFGYHQEPPEPTADQYCAGYGHPFYATHPDGWGSCLCGERTYPAQMDAFERRGFLDLLGRDLEVANGELGPMFSSLPLLIAGPLFWEVWRANTGRSHRPRPSVEAEAHALRVSGWRP